MHLPHAIVQTGPYRRVRHPVYTANLLLLGGIALATGSLWMVLDLVVLAVFYLRSAVLEERALRQEHPDYAGYMLRTGRFLPAIRG